MDSQSPVLEMAPVIMWQKEHRPEFYRQYWSQVSESPTKQSLDLEPGSTSRDLLAAADDGEAIDTSFIPLDNGMPVDYGAIKVVQLLIEHHNAVKYSLMPI